MYFINGGSAGEYVHSLTEISYLLSIVFLGVLSTAGTSLLSIYAVSQLPVIQVSVFNNVATLITILSGVLILSEPFYYYHIIGAIVIILGVVIVNVKKPLEHSKVAS
ncbi:EamA family transporter [Oceanobacillus jeddahense]|uniref:EamA family transporter n=1 Tax=Oceanobacillus jeddahense TaxID=1462527 RepID=UPI003631AB4B